MVGPASQTRRDVLKLSGAALATAAGAGVVSANHEHPNVETQFPSFVGRASATLEGGLTELGEASSADVFFEWRQDDPSLDWNTTPRQTVTSPTDFSETIDGLFGQTWHEYRAVVDTSDGDGDTGDIQHFETDGIEPMDGATE